MLQTWDGKKPERALIRMLIKLSTTVLSGILVLHAAYAAANPDAQLPAFAQEHTAQVHVADTLNVMSLNLAHGRKDSINQFLVSEEQTRQNLHDIAEVLEQRDIDVLALQEADAPSRWSGGFDHLAELSMQTAYTERLHSLHARNWIYNFGTALLSRIGFVENIQHTFTPSPPTTNKGFTLGQIAWQYDSEKPRTLHVDLVSIHLDFSRQSVRERQIHELVSILNQRNNPRVIMGDFNTDWQDEDGLIQGLVERLDLHTYEPDSLEMGTYPSSGRRLDWILVSRELSIQGYDTLPDTLSDHLAVIASLRVKPQKNQATASLE